MGRADQQVMVREKVEQDWFDMVAHAVELNSLVVVDVEVLGLSHCEHLVILQEANVTNLFLCLELGH